MPKRVEHYWIFNIAPKSSRDATNHFKLQRCAHINYSPAVNIQSSTGRTLYPVRLSKTCQTVRCWTVAVPDTVVVDKEVSVVCTICM